MDFSEFIELTKISYNIDRIANVLEKFLEKENHEVEKRRLIWTEEERKDYRENQNFSEMENL